MTIEKLKSVFIKKGYIWNENLNIIGVRNKAVGNKITNKFDDTLYLAYKVGGNWLLKEYIITTDPGTYYMKMKLLNEKGCAILAEGQYLNIYAIRLHQGKYLSVCQTYGAVKLFRDGNKNDTYDFTNLVSDTNSGINIHCAGEDTIEINQNSAGCSVFKRKKDFNDFLTICTNYKALFGNKYTYTLINSLDLI